MAEKLVPGGFLGASLIAGGGGGLFLSEPVTNAEANTLLRGEVVRISGNSTVLRARANLPANVVGLAGVMFNNTATGGLGSIVNSGRAFVLLEPALVPVAGEALWVSAATAGLATNVAPALAVYLGVIKDASGYGATGGVIADLAPSYALSTTLNTLRSAYNAGTLAADQELIITDAHGGGVVINATTPPPNYTGVTAFEIDVIGGSVNFYRVGGFDVVSARAITAPAAISTWNANAFLSSTLTLTAGGVAPNLLSCTVFEAPVITQTAGAVYTIPVSSTVSIKGPPTASPAGGALPVLTEALSLHVESGRSLYEGTFTVQADGDNLGIANTLFNVRFTNAADTRGLVFGYSTTLTRAIIATSTAGDEISFYTHNGTAWGSRFEIKAVGNVNINGNFASGAYFTYIQMGTWDVFGSDNPGGTVLALGGFRAAQWVGLTFHTSGVEAARFTSSANFVIGATAAGATAAKCLALTNSATAPTTSPDLAQLYAADHNGVGGAAALAVYQEAALVASGDKAATHEWLVTINGTPMWVLCRDSAG